MISPMFNNLLDRNRLIEGKVGCFHLADLNEESLKEFFSEYEGVSWGGIHYLFLACYSNKHLKDGKFIHRFEYPICIGDIIKDDGYLELVSIIRVRTDDECFDEIGLDALVIDSVEITLVKLPI